MEYKAFVGIDISKLTLDVVILFPSKQAIIHRKVDNTENGFKQLLSWLKKHHDVLDDTLFCMEHTGVYGLPLSSFLSKNQLYYSFQAPLHIHKSMGLRRGKNDKADAAMLAKFAYLNKDEIKLSGVPSKSVQNIKNLLSFRERLVRSKVSLECPANELAAFTEKDLHITILRNSNKYVKQLKESILQVESEINSCIKSIPEIKRVADLIMSVPGIGPITTANLIVYTNCFTLFENWRKLACYCGVAPFEHSSGTSIKGKTKVSKFGNKKLKFLLGMGAVVAINCDDELKKYYDRRIKEGKDKSSTLNVIKNKMLSRAFAAVKRGTPYVKLKQSNEKISENKKLK